MTEVKHQKIVVLLSLNSGDKNLILNGIRIASIFRKELCLCYNNSGKDLKEHEAIEENLSAYLIPVKNNLPGLKSSWLILSEKFKVLPERLADDYEAILMIAASGEFEKYSKSVRESPVPFLFVNEKSNVFSEFKKLILPVDLRSENKDSGLWCSYFGRFNSSAIVVVAANDKNKDDQKQVGMNLALIKRLFLKAKVEFKIFKGTKSSFKNSFEALDLALTSNCDLLVILGSLVISPIDLMVGLPEKKILKKAGNLPVLVVNPTKDNYILCD